MERHSVDGSPRWAVEATAQAAGGVTLGAVSEQPYFRSDAEVLPASAQEVASGPDLVQSAELLDGLGADLDAVEAALARLASEDAGKCELCGAEIDLDLLRADPLSNRCGSHVVPA